MSDAKKNYEAWKTALAGSEYEKEAAAIGADEALMADSFYKDLEFGTAGMRGVLGLGTNRMNIFTVRRCSKGLADYINAKGEGEKGVSIAYDSRRMSLEFARETAGVLCANDIRVYLSPTIKSVPQLSFSILELKTAAGVVITASHNPAVYNGYKVYGSDGGQVAPEDADEITRYIENTDFFGIKTIPLDEAEKCGLLTYTGEDLNEIYYKKVKALISNPSLIARQADSLGIVYTPLFGSGNIPVCRILSDIGIKKLHVVKEQQEPNGDFPGLSAPNPENPEAFILAEKLAEKTGADLILATDPDSDRLGVAARDENGGFKVLTGNQIGCIILDYLITQTKLNGDEFVAKSLVSTEMADAICAQNGVELRSVYTGFKFIAEQIKISCETGAGRFLFGFEESYGFLKGTFVRDKDAIIAAALLCEVAAFYAEKAITLCGALNAMYEKYGFFMDKVLSKTLSGAEGIGKIKNAVETLRKNPLSEINGMKTLAVRDYGKNTRTTFAGLTTPLNMEPSNVIYYELEGGRFILRPSGTEPKIKSYISFTGKTKAEALSGIASLEAEVTKLIDELTK